MNTNLKILLPFSFIMLAAFAVGCSDLKDTLPSPSQTIGAHPSGWATETSADFHGTAIKDQKWDIRPCKSCHGNDYSGGASAPSCRTCHTDVLGPEHCNVCHGSDANSAPPKDLQGNTSETFRGVGKHQIHLLGTSWAAAVGCSNCHILPSGNIYDPAHIDSLPGRAEINFSGLAKHPTSGVNPVPVYNDQSGSCSNTYCHGNFRNGTGANQMFWNGGAIFSAACGSCHGDVTKSTLAEKALPGGTHPNNLACSTCHGGVVDASLKFVNPAKHVDGRLNLYGSDVDF